MQMNFQFNTQQLEALQAAITRQLQAAKRVAGLTLEHEAQVIMKHSWDEIPVWTGAAMSTGFVKPGKDANGDPIVSIGYDGTIAENPVTGIPVEDYLFTLHENLYAHHINGKAKFLEDPLLEYIPTLAIRLRNILQYEMKYGESPLTFLRADKV